MSTLPTLHAEALESLRSWVAPDARQEHLRERYVTHLEAHPDGLQRSCRPDHVTASTLVVTADLSRVLLTLHAKAGRWFQFGGHCEPGDLRLVEAATREAREESGLPDLYLDPTPVQLSEHAVPFCRDPDAPPAAVAGGSLGQTVHHLDVRFLAVVAPDVVPEVSDESLDVRWWPAHDLPDPDADLVDLVRLAGERLGVSAGAGAWISPGTPAAE